MATWKKIITSGSSAELSSLTLDTALPVAQGGTGATTLTDGGILFGNGTGAIQASAVLADGEMLVGDGTTEPSIESGATLRTSIGVGTGDSPQFTGLTLSGDLTVQGGDITLTNAATDIDLIDNNASALSFDASGKAGILEIDTTNSAEKVKMSGDLSVTGIISGSTISGSFVGDGSNLTGLSQDIDSLSAGSAIVAGDKFLYSDAGTEKSVTFAIISSSIFENISGDATIAAGGALTIAADSVENSMLANMTRGTVKVGGGSNAPTDLDAKTDGQILVGDGTDINSVAVSGDVTLANNGAVTIANDAVDNNKLANIARGSIKVGGGSNAPTDLDAKGDGKILVGDGTDVASVAVSGDVTLANNGAVTIADNTIGNSELKQNDDITLQSLTTTNNIVVGGDLTVNGTTTTVATTNTKVEDKFMFLATGSAATNTDAGIMVQSGSVDLSGSAFYHDINAVAKTNPNGGRWSVAKSLGHDVGTVTPLQFVTTVKTDTVNPSSESGSYGAGEMHVNTDSGEIWIRFE